MKSIPKTSQKLFRKWGQQGGEARKRLLSAGRRRSIASQAARARWGKINPVPLMPSVRLEKPSWEDPVYLEEILAEGNLREWRRLYRQVADHPFGEITRALEQVVRSVEIYGTTRLWKSLLSQLQGGMGA